MEGGHFEVGGKRNSTFGHVEFKRNEWSKFAHTMSFTNKPPKKSQAIFTVLGHVVEAQRLPESCQLYLQNWRSF